MYMIDYHFLIDEGILTYFQSLPGSVSEHIRIAMWEYRQKRQEVSESLSKGGNYVQPNSETQTR